MNREVIAIDQDKAGIQGLKFMAEDGLEFWFKPLETMSGLSAFLTVRPRRKNMP